MQRMTTIRVTALGLLAIAAFLSLSMAGRSKIAAGSGPGNIISLHEPPFLNVAHAQENVPTEPDAVNSFADDEAGIAAYFDANMNINLNNVDQLFRTIEEQTNSYILGSLPLPDYDEDHDPHVYISTNGWVMAYYRKDEPTSKIYDWVHYSGGSVLPTKLEQALELVANEIGASFTTADYYHFNYPNATDLMLIAEWAQGYLANDGFDILIPSAFSYYERSWSLVGYSDNMAYSCTSQYELNGTQIAEAGQTKGWSFVEGLFTVNQLPTNNLHTVTVKNHDTDCEVIDGGLALVYRVP